jgi:hypothetical protein
MPPEARTLALEVRALFTQGNNRKVWEEQIREFMRRGAEHVAARRRADARARRAENAAFKRIRQERLAVEEGKARPRLTGDKPPGKGWGLGTVHGGKYLSEFGWLPPRLYAYLVCDTKNPWPADGSPSAMFTLLAVLHDTCLVPSVKPILPVDVSSPAEVARRKDLGVWALLDANMCVWGRLREDKGFLATLQAYLIDVRAFVAQSDTEAAQTGRPTQPTIGTVTGDGSMALVKAVNVICGNPQLAQALQRNGLTVIETPDRPIYDLAPAVYLHAPPLVVAEPDREAFRDFQDLIRGFAKTVERLGGPPFTPTPESPLPSRLHESIVAGHVLGIVFAEEVNLDTRLAGLPWAEWRATRRVIEGQCRQWKQPAITPAQVSRSPSPQYTVEVLRGLLPVAPPYGHRWQVGFQFRGETPAVAAHEVDAPWARRLLLQDAKRRGQKYFQEPKAPWAEMMLFPKGGLTVGVVIVPRDSEGLPRQTLAEAVAKSYGVALADVGIAPLFVNALGEWLGVAVRIGSGAVLVLPEFPDKAAVLKRLVTDLWGPIREWLAEPTRAAPQPADRTEGMGDLPPGIRQSSPSAPAEDVVPTPQQTKGKPGAVKDSLKLAHNSYEWVCEKRPDLVPSGRSRFKEAMHKAVKDSWQGYSDAGVACPCFETWKRYVREYERIVTGPTNTSRTGRIGKSIVDGEHV